MLGRVTQLRTITARVPCVPCIASIRLYNKTTTSRPISDRAPTRPLLDFTDTQLTYQSKTTPELWRSLLVLQTCTYQVFVRHAEPLMWVARKLLGKKLFDVVMKGTFYGQFAGGENMDELKPCVERLAQNGVHSMLNYSVEADMGESRGEEACERHLETLLGVLQDSKEVCEGRHFSSFKITGLTTPGLLVQITEVLVGMRRVFQENSVLGNRTGFEEGLSLDIKCDHELLFNRRISKKRYMELTGDAGTAESEYLDYYEFRDGLMRDLHLLHNIPGVPHMTSEITDGLDRLMTRLECIADKTKVLDARIMIDAEQTYMQPAIDYMTLLLMRKHNTDTAYICNTYQCYLKTTRNTVTLDARDAARRGYQLGVKLVRGAYMDEERERAVRHCYPSPIQDSKAATDANYDAMLEVLLQLVVRGGGTLLAGGHNEASIEFLMTRMGQLGIDKRAQQVYFGQLYGLCDPISFMLSSAGYNVVKAIAWGPVEAVLPFLARRAQENKGVLGGTTRELDLLKREIGRRTKSIS